LFGSTNEPRRSETRHAAPLSLSMRTIMPSREDGPCLPRRCRRGRVPAEQARRGARPARRLRRDGARGERSAHTRSEKRRGGRSSEFMATGRFGPGSCCAARASDKSKRRDPCGFRDPATSRRIGR
jgi:hypothetical protein